MLQMVDPRRSINLLDPSTHSAKVVVVPIGTCEMLRGLGIILWVKDRIVKSNELAREESEDIRVCEITPELYYIWKESVAPLHVTSN